MASGEYIEEGLGTSSCLGDCSYLNQNGECNMLILSNIRGNNEDLRRFYLMIGQNLFLEEGKRTGTGRGVLMGMFDRLRHP